MNPTESFIMTHFNEVVFLIIAARTYTSGWRHCRCGKITQPEQEDFKMEKYTNASAATWARTICLIVALLNSLLASFNKSPLPIDNEQLQQLVSTLITVVVAIINWWKNNSFTKEAIEADELFARLRAENNARK